MKRERLCRLCIAQLNNVTVDYYLTVDDEALYEKFGVCLVKITDGDLIEEFACVDHVWFDRQDAVSFIRRLVKGEAMPITLTDIIEDYLN